MCETCAPSDVNGAAHGANASNGAHAENGTNGVSNGAASQTPNGNAAAHPEKRKALLPYQNVGDFLSNLQNFKIIESTLREGEQFANAFFDTQTKVKMYVPGSGHACIVSILCVLGIKSDQNTVQPLSPTLVLNTSS